MVILWGIVSMKEKNEIIQDKVITKYEEIFQGVLYRSIRQNSLFFKETIQEPIFNREKNDIEYIARYIIKPITRKSFKKYVSDKNTDFFLNDLFILNTIEISDDLKKKLTNNIYLEPYISLFNYILFMVSRELLLIEMDFMDKIKTEDGSEILLYNIFLKQLSENKKLVMDIILEQLIDIDFE